MAPKKKELASQLDELRERHDALAEIVNGLATHTAVVALAVRNPNTVPADDLEAALTGITEIHAALRRPPAA
jgi:hypothetical protein